MGLQPHQPTRAGQSKWRDGFDHDRLQHETGDEYNGNRETIGKTQEMEAGLRQSFFYLIHSSHFKAIWERSYFDLAGAA